MRSPGIGTKDTADGLKSLDVRALGRGGYLATPGCRLVVTWSRNGMRTGRILLLVLKDALRLEFTSTPVGGEPSDIIQRVTLTWTDCHYGGQRPWFRCPGAGCDRRVAKLYASGLLFLCRHCYRLAYVSQRETRHLRLFRKAQNIRERLGGSRSLLDAFPRRPKGMHRATYLRLYGKALAAEQEGLVFRSEALLQTLEPLARRAGLGDRDGPQ